MIHLYYISTLGFFISPRPRQPHLEKLDKNILIQFRRNYLIRRRCRDGERPGSEAPMSLLPACRFYKESLFFVFLKKEGKHTLNRPGFNLN